MSTKAQFIRLFLFLFWFILAIKSKVIHSMVRSKSVYIDANTVFSVQFGPQCSKTAYSSSSSHVCKFFYQIVQYSCINQLILATTFTLIFTKIFRQIFTNIDSKSAKLVSLFFLYNFRSTRTIVLKNCLQQHQQSCVQNFLPNCARFLYKSADFGHNFYLDFQLGGFIMMHHVTIFLVKS